MSDEYESSSSSNDDGPMTLVNRPGLEHASKRFIDNLVMGGSTSTFAGGDPNDVGVTLVTSETTAEYSPGLTKNRNDPAFLTTGGIVYPMRTIRHAIRRRDVNAGTKMGLSDVLEYSVRHDGTVHFTVLTAADGPVRVVMDAPADDLIMCMPVTGDEGNGVSGGAHILPAPPSREAMFAVPSRPDFYRRPTTTTTTTTRTPPLRERTNRVKSRTPIPATGRRSRPQTVRSSLTSRDAQSERRPPRKRQRRASSSSRRNTRATAAERRRQVPVQENTTPARSTTWTTADIPRPPMPLSEGSVGPGAEGCGICLDRPVCTVMIPCGHMVTCLTCSANPNLRACPICRVRLTQIVQTHSAGHRPAQ